MKPLGEHVITAPDTRATTEELLDVVFSLRPVSYQVLKQVISSSQNFSFLFSQ
jgi:hypothetical protein